MTQLDYNNYKKIPYENIMNEICAQYIFEYGESKAKDIIAKSSSSTKAQNLLFNIHMSRKMPSPLDLVSCFNTIPFMFFSKPETICLATIAFTMVAFDEDTDLLPENESSYVMEIVYQCEKMKFSKSDTFFTRVYKRLVSEY
jgi:hypothetical protein